MSFDKIPTTSTGLKLYFDIKHDNHIAIRCTLQERQFNAIETCLSACSGASYMFIAIEQFEADFSNSRLLTISADILNAKRHLHILVC